MHAIKELKLQSFKDAFLPRPCELFARYGYNKHADRNMSGDNSLPVRESKADTLTRLNKEMFED